MESSRVTDLTYLKEASANNMRFLREMIEIFLKQTPGLIASLHTASRDKNWIEFRRIMHKLKPSITMMGIHELETDILKIDNAVKNGIEIELLPLLLQKFEEVCNSSYEELRNELKLL
ncbi:MAG TPA: Hpt domain-containing protein [Cytophagaceae bacterium]|jgi:HPt (histidine-containing phosphotransfer) domain-containing protein|nr:Hpt domain-containing protein [Cytophagaceae bacterium]